MSILGDAINRSRGRHRASSPSGDEATLTPAPAATLVAPAPHPPRSAASRDDDGRTELARRRDALAEQVTEMHWDLGGLAYEMAIRDHFRLDVLVARAAALQERDAELAEVERLLALEETATAGTCPVCAAPHSRGAVYCWQCGATLMASSPGFASGASGDIDGSGARIAPMDALLADAQRDGGAGRSALPPDA
jgi:hypothetical protein